MTYRYPGGLVRRTAANTSITGASGVWDLGSQAQAVKTNTWPISGLANPVSGSLRFRSSASAYLSRTPASAATSTTKGTISLWFKGIGQNQNYLIGKQDGTIFYLYFNSSSQLVWQNGGVNTFITTQVFRDPSAWYHLVASWDTTQATSSNRQAIYLNGQQITAFGTTNNLGLNAVVSWFDNDSNVRGIGSYTTGGYFDGYMTEINAIDGQALTPSSFGQTSPITGVWEPIKYTGTYGTNGFYLSLSDTSSIGKDFSGNGNNWTPNNISTASGSTFDLMRDVPTQYTPQGVTDVGGTVRGNYATLNNNIPSAAVINGGLTRNSSSGRSSLSTMILQNGKYYFETTIQDANGNGGVGVKQSTAYPLGDYETAKSATYFANGEYKIEGGSQTSGFSSYTNGDVIGIAVDTTQSPAKIWFAKNNTWQGTGNPTTAGYSLTSGLDYYFMVLHGSGSSSTTASVNFGQQPFAYTPPSGFKSLCTTNLPTPTIGATTATAANKYFDATTYTGTGASLSVTNAGSFQPDFVWLKSRSAATNNQIFDAIRGTTKVLVTNSTESESTSANTLTAFNSNGFTVSTNTAINTSSATYVAWQWNAGGSTVTNTSGTISSQVRASTTSGFSVVTYTGNGTSGATVGHGLGVAPSLVIVKFRKDVASDGPWYVYHSSIGATKNLILNTTAGEATASTPWNNTAPTSSVFSLGNAGDTNGSGRSFVAYCWSEVVGFSKFGSYTGNGSTDGPFIYTGFKPRFIMWKNSSATEAWLIEDTARSTYNQVALELYPSSSGAEAAGSSRSPTQQFDFLSNGFKVRGAQQQTNGSGNTIIYAAFAEHPFKNSLAR